MAQCVATIDDCHVIAKLGQQFQGLVETPVYVTDNVQRTALVLLVIPQRLRDESLVQRGPQVT